MRCGTWGYNVTTLTRRRILDLLFFLQRVRQFERESCEGLWRKDGLMSSINCSLMSIIKLHPPLCVSYLIFSLVCVCMAMMLFSSSFFSCCFPRRPNILGGFAATDSLLKMSSPST